MIRLIKRLGRSLLHLLAGLVILAGSAIGLAVCIVIAVIRYAVMCLWHGCLLLYALLMLILNPEPRDV